MSKALGKRCVWGFGALAFAIMLAAAARAEVSSDLSGSILVYPKVLFQGTTTDDRDTVIQLTNTSNLMVHAKCFYVNAAPANPSLPPGPFNPRLWQETDFEVWLTRQQPTHWVASQGRFVNPTDGFGNDGSGLDPGAVPPVPAGFEGELKCIQVDASGTPFGGNSLKGEALLRRADGDVSKYNAVAILATGAISNDNVIRLDNTPASNDGEANSCHDVLFLDHFADGAVNPVIRDVAPSACDADNCPITTELTLVPCDQDFENQIPGRVKVQFEITNEFEQQFSASTTVDCWFNERIGFIGSSQGTGPFSATVLGTTTAFTRIIPVFPDGGLIGVAEEFHSDDTGDTASAAWDLQAEGEFVNGRFLPRTRFDATLGIEGGPVVDEIVIPEGF